MSLRGFVVLDRDGTIIAEKHYLSNPDEVVLLPGAAAGLHRMAELGLKRIVVTNQSGVARGYFDLARVEAIHARMIELLAQQSASLDAIYVCPHSPEDGCTCRKPLPGLLERAAVEHHVDLHESFVIGDKPCDIDLGRAVGATTILVRTGYGASCESQGIAGVDHVADDLAAAAEIIAGIVARR